MGWERGPTIQTWWWKNEAWKFWIGLFGLLWLLSHCS